jgi:hypothetical protein
MDRFPFYPFLWIHWTVIFFSLFILRVAAPQHEDAWVTPAHFFIRSVAGTWTQLSSNHAHLNTQRIRTCSPISLPSSARNRLGGRRFVGDSGNPTVTTLAAVVGCSWVYSPHRAACGYRREEGRCVAAIAERKRERGQKQPASGRCRHAPQRRAEAVIRLPDATTATLRLCQEQGGAVTGNVLPFVLAWGSEII